MAPAFDDSTIYLLGGIRLVGKRWPDGVSVNNVIGFEPRYNRWRTFRSMPQARGSGAAAVVGNELHFVGGGTFKPGKYFVQVSMRTQFHVCETHTCMHDTLTSLTSAGELHGS
jgi:N-acetylneuraminic acid mutarotase